jgi:glucose-1-phosphate adenylyltransferase
MHSKNATWLAISLLRPGQGRHCRIKRAIIDRDVHLPEGTVIGYDPAEDKRHYHVTPSGLTVVTRDHSLYESPVKSDFMNGPH